MADSTNLTAIDDGCPLVGRQTDLRNAIDIGRLVMAIMRRGEGMLFISSYDGEFSADTTGELGGQSSGGRERLLEALEVLAPSVGRRRCHGPCGKRLPMSAFNPRSRGEGARKAVCKRCLAGKRVNP